MYLQGIRPYQNGEESAGGMIRYHIKSLIEEKEFQEGRRVTIAEVAKAIGIHRVTLSRMANSRGGLGQIPVERIEKLCRYFRCTPNDLMTIVPDSPEGGETGGKEDQGKKKPRGRKATGG